jgi:hypothetical protein
LRFHLIVAYRKFFLPAFKGLRRISKSVNSSGRGCGGKQGRRVIKERDRQ